MIRRPVLPGCVLAVLLVTGCGAESPGEAVPSLTAGVAAVDEAVAAGDRSAARDALEALVADADQAVADGDLESGARDDVVAAAEALLDALGPEPEGEPEAGPEPTEETSEPEPEERTTPKGPKEPKEPKGPKGPKPGKGPKDERD